LEIEKDLIDFKEELDNLDLGENIWFCFEKEKV
jgi:hypothetical protein